VFSSETKDEFHPKQNKLPVAPPDDAVVLFNSADNLKFVAMNGDKIDWPIEEGELVSSKGKGRTNHIVSTIHFCDADIHVEFMLPQKGPGNSGIYIHGNYELQIYNSTGKEKPTQDDMGALYGFAPPLVNAARPPGEWQVYDIRYHAPRRDADGKITEEGSLTAWLNGQLVQKETRFGEPRSKYHPFRYGTTPYLEKIAKQMHKTSVGPLFLQDHDSPVRFRNVWIKPLDDKAIVPDMTKSGTE